jgi:CDP-diacylglycerol--glycerol-3-phosphate 3-phosphatidyltransferase
MSAPIHPNILTAMRLPLAPMAVYCMLQENVTGLALASALALVLEATDLLDGWVARRYGVVTNFGKLFDPFSDAFCRYTLFLGFYAIDVAALWMIIAIFYRDATISFLRTVAATKSIVIYARTSGKFKAIVQGVGTQVIMVTLLMAQIQAPPAWAENLPQQTMTVVTLITLASLFDYLYGNREILAEAWSEEPA